MSESIVRKIQPFTIGTRLSAPAVPKCQEFTPSYLQGQALDNCTLQHNLNSLYLRRSQLRAHGSRLASPIIQQIPAAKHSQEDMAADDQLNQNVAVSRSIKKITISGSKVRSQGPAQLSVGTLSSENKNNNNNVSTTSEPHLPRIVGVNCENTPNSQFKISPSESSEKETCRKESRPLAVNGESTADCFTQRHSLFSQEVLQAESWIKSKLQDLKDGCKLQRCPLQDLEEASQTLQRELKDFENTLIQLNQMGDQLICKLNPSADTVKKQLGHLRDQWHVLKQTAAGQTRALGGAKNIHEFHKKVDKLEAWIKEKEEEQSLVDVLEANDKVQLTRRILDLKEDEQLYRNLHEEINHLALKLEKQGKTDGKNICSRRKNINKMYTVSLTMTWWLKVQSYLKNCHENLQLALEVSSFYQQADNVLLAIDNMRKSMSASKELDLFGERDIRDIASQIMMLDVSVSQLSNLHPALTAGVIQKQSEVKECWTLLQKIFRSDRTALSHTGPMFTREDADPLTSASDSQNNMGDGVQRIMGKEVKEGKNRLKGCVTTLDWGSGSPPQQSGSHTSSPMGDGPACGNDVRHQLKGGRKLSVQPKLAAAPRGHTQLHIQLQKFTVSADKTLSWLKDNVLLATQVSSIATYEGLDAAKKYQEALEQEILSNRDRIEVVKREGHGLVRAQHPGSAKIQEFLSQLENLWEELRRRHQRNAVFLQASKELGFRVVKVLQALGSLEAWLESVELSMKESSLAADAETMTEAERESCLLEKEVAARRLELSALRQEVDLLQGHSHPLTRALPARMEEVERKYQSVLSALTQQSSELQDTRMLTEFLERVELEESMEFSRFSLDQPLHGEISSPPALLELQSSGDGEPLIEPIGDPVEELREAVEMLNDTVRERGRSQSHDQAVQELLSKHSRLAVCVEECLCCSKELCLDILEQETDMAIQCEPDRCGLEALEEKQGHLEAEYEVIREEVGDMESQVSILNELCPERVSVLRAKIQATLQAWRELETSVAENRSRLQEFVQLQDFFRSYLAMISWTEDTRSCIFSNTALNLGRDGQSPLASELDRQIEQKFDEFDKLESRGKDILDEGHHLSQMVKERMEELQSMLGWILVHWRAQKQQQHRKSQEEASQDNIYCEAATLPENPPHFWTNQSFPAAQSEENYPNGSRSPTQQEDQKPAEDGYEVMKSINPQDCKPPPKESPKPSIMVFKDPGSPSLGGTVNLILSFGNTGESEVQVLDPPGRMDEDTEEIFEPIHRVSTYLHVKDSNLTAAPVYESITLPPQKRASASPIARSPSAPSPPCPASSLSAANVSFHLLTGSGSSSILSSLKTKSKKRKRKRDARRHTIQKIMGVEEETEEPLYSSETYDTHTWPLKEARRRKSSQKGSDATAMAYVKNPLLQDIDTECSEDTITPYAISEGPNILPSTSQARGHCRFLSLGSVLSFDLPKDMTLIPSIQDIITIAPPESKKAVGTDPDPHSQRPSSLSSFKQIRASKNSAADVSETIKTSPEDEPPGSSVSRDVGQALSRTQANADGTSTGVKKSGQVTELPIYINQPNRPATAAHKHECISVHTRIRDLNGHKYHRCARPTSVHGESSAPCLSQASHMVVSLKSSVSARQDSVDSGISTSSSVKFSTEPPCTENPQPIGVVGQVMSLEVEHLAPDSACVRSSEGKEELKTEAVHLDHQQFEEEEEELEDIWSRNSQQRQSICSDIMYQPNPAESNETSSEAPAVLYRKLATASAPNLLVAEFRLPAHIQTMLGYDKDQSPKGGPPLTIGDRRSWAAFSKREQPCKTSVVLNETASVPLKLPESGDNRRYIYQYKEEEEDVEESQVDEKKANHQTDASLLSVQLSCGGHEGKDGFDQEQRNTEEPSAASGGRTTPSGKSELQSMEGTLERKQKLQLGGKKASSRGWSSCHAVLYRHTLCFYQDRKDTLRSSACGLPLNLTGADCSPAPEYTKKPNCFRLRLRDGSEYLLNASSRFMMKKWMMKIQGNTGQTDSSSSSVSADQTFPVSLNPPLCSGCHGLASCFCSSRRDVVSTFPRRKPLGHSQANEIVVLSRELGQMPQSRLRSLHEHSTGSCDDYGRLKHTVTHRLSAESCHKPSSPSSPVSPSQDLLSSKRRSHSFTSATYQKIKPVLQPSGAAGSNYCVTLLVGDKTSERSDSDVPLVAEAGWRQGTCLDTCTSLPRPRNKSVFRKIFGKRDI
ncbi:uncharacterized protein LOC128765358 isoform X3 [Synchiropus splendidus]|uniref:uncharacterized protein LOC128765358 isoform X3 n=1 Tax=Synchiropus splendidus TaxID=270530 RepID=UPI00237E11D3|nr:uncharacterized protein LOC128765358 isoform X3 [Synchiropus splendidus]